MRLLVPGQSPTKSTRSKGLTACCGLDIAGELCSYAAAHNETGARDIALLQCGSARLTQSAVVRRADEKRRLHELLGQQLAPTIVESD